MSADLQPHQGVYRWPLLSPSGAPSLLLDAALQPAWCLLLTWWQSTGISSFRKNSPPESRDGHNPQHNAHGTARYLQSHRSPFACPIPSRRPPTVSVSRSSEPLVPTAPKITSRHNALQVIRSTLFPRYTRSPIEKRMSTRRDWRRRDLCR